ncbi:MAG: oxidoreductase [Hyphomonadaceae bacterium]|nr:oxidoreductase [Hyphomonadaceae bacterium]
MAQTPQAPIGSGFHAKSSAMEVIQGIDLSGKSAIVTGGYSGIGLETVRALSVAGADIVVPARRPSAARSALSDLGGEIKVLEMDLADLASVNNFAQDYLATGKPLHLLINNAGIMTCPETRIGPGWESQFGVNHLGHFALTNALLPALRKAAAARVIALSSTAHIRGDVLWDDPHFHSTPYDKWRAYSQSKSANALFARHADALWKSEGIRAFSVHPGGIFTPLQRHLTTEEMAAMGWMNPDGSIPPEIQLLFKTPEQGASTTVWAATSPQLNGMGGVYCENADIAQAAGPDSARWEHVREWVCDEAKAARLWEMSEKMLADA